MRQLPPVEMFEHGAGPMQLCPDPDNCTELHNDIVVDNQNEQHHYGCECPWCLRFYWSLKN